MKFVDRLRQQTNATSTATVMLGSSVVGFRTVAQAISDGDLAVGDEIAMCLESGTSWEISRYRVDSATQLTRLDVLSSWTGGDAVMFPGGGKEIFCTVPAEYLQGVPVSALQAMASVSDTTRLLAMNAAGELLTVTAAVLKAYMGGTSAPVDNSPTLSGASGAATGANSASGSVTTNEAGGTLYWLFSTASTATAAQVKAGSSKAVAASGVQNVSASGLTTSTQYYLHFLHRDSAGQDSAVVTSLPFTTQAAGTPSPTVTSVTISPKTVTLAGGATQQFTGTAAGTNSPPQTFTFETNLGTVDANTGAYVAAAGTSSAQTATVTMRSTLNPDAVDTATVTIAAVQTGPTMAERYIAEHSGLSGTSMFSTLTFSGGTAPNQYAGGSLTIKIADKDGNLPPVDSVKIGFSKSNTTPPPKVFSDTTGIPYSVNGGTTGNVPNSFKLLKRLSNQSSYPAYHNIDGATIYMGGTAGTQYPWLFFSDGSIKVYDDGGRGFAGVVVS